jgi:hypothetical protein
MANVFGMIVSVRLLISYFAVSHENQWQRQSTREPQF